LFVYFSKAANVLRRIKLQNMICYLFRMSLAEVSTHADFIGFVANPKLLLFMWGILITTYVTNICRQLPTCHAFPLQQMLDI